MTILYQAALANFSFDCITNSVSFLQKIMLFQIKNVKLSLEMLSQGRNKGPRNKRTNFTQTYLSYNGKLFQYSGFQRVNF